MRVVLTGAAGWIGSNIRGPLAQRWDLVCNDLRPGDGIDPLDVRDGDACRAAFAGADAVVHLAGDPRPDAGWDTLLPANVVGTYEVATAAVDAGVKRLVLASSLQAVSAYPLDRQVRSDDMARPANLYGATKAWAESIGTWIGTTTSTSVVVLRIGHFRETPPPIETSTPRDVAAWLSVRDCVELVRAAVEGPVEGCTVVSGVSANRYRKAEHGPAERALGYAPVDDAWAT